MAPQREFNRERFLLLCVAWIIGVQYGVYILGATGCAYLSNAIIKDRLKKDTMTVPGASLPFCASLPEDMHKSVEGSLSVMLALLGGGALAAGEIQRRRKPPDDDDGDAGGRGDL